MIVRTIAILALMLLSVAVHAEVPAKPLPDIDWLYYRVTFPEDDRDDSLQLSPWIENTEQFRGRGYSSEWQGRPAYVMEKEDITSSGIRILWKYTLNPDGLWLWQLEKTLVDADGREMGVTRYDFENPQWNYPARRAHLFSIIAVLAGMELDEETEERFYMLLTEDASPWPVELEVEGVETVTVPAGEFACYKVVLEPDIANIMGRWSWAAPIIWPFVPDFVLWVEQTRPHHLVRFEGRFGPVGASAKQIYERIPAPEAKSISPEKDAE